MLALWIIVIGFTVQAEVRGQTWDQSTLDDFSQNLKLKVNILDNTVDTDSYQAEIVMENQATRTLTKNGNWSIHFDSMFMLEPKTMLVGNLPNPDGAVIKGQGFRVHHVAGTHFYLEPTDEFFDFPPRTNRKIQYTGANWKVAKTDVMPNWYLTAPGLAPKLITSTADESLKFVGEFSSAKQWKRYSTDRYNPYTAQQRYERNYVPESTGNDDVRIVPTPHKMTINKDRNVTLDKNLWKVYALPDVRAEGDFLREAAEFGEAGATVDKYVIKLSKENVQLPNDIKNSGPDAYYLSVNTKNNVIVIKGQDASGVFCGIQTLLGLMSKDRVVYETEVWDAPRFSYRGMHLDVARNFRDKEDVKRLLDVMSTYKMNTLHLHLADDEGWRLEIPGLPELTEIGSKRCYDPTETRCLTSQLGSGPLENSSGSGHYTVSDYKEILRYANRRHIQVIPEIESPGHARAAVKSMEARSKKLLKSGDQQEAKRFLLQDENDASKYMSVQMFTDNAINPCVESAFSFIDFVINQLKILHQDVQPLKTFHFGGDEVSHGAWVNSSRCRQLQNSPKVKTDEIKEFFFKRLANITKTYGLDIAAWEDGLMRDAKTPYDKSRVPNTNVYAYAWDNVWEWGAAGRAYTLANDGYKVIMSQATHLYFDHPYEPDPDERGLYWAPRFIDSQKTFGFTPLNLYENIDVRRSGAPLNKQDVCQKDGSGCPPLTVPENVIGMQGQLWSETVRTSEELDYMIFPRLLSVAERAWHEASWESQNDKETRDRKMRLDWESFARTLGSREFRRLDRLGVKYRIPPPGAKLVDGVMKVTSGFPPLEVQYSTNHGQNWSLVTKDLTVARDSMVMLRTMSPDLKRYSRSVIFNPAGDTPVSDQTVLDYIAKNVRLSYSVLDNFIDGTDDFLAQISLKNIGTKNVSYGNWAIYFCSIYHIVDSFPGGKVLEKYKIKFVHINGCLHRLEPVSGFPALQPAEKRDFKLKIKFWSVSRTDVMPNWYVSSDGMNSTTIASTAGQDLNFVGDFDTVNKWKRYTEDKFDPYTPDGRFARNSDAKDLGKAPLPVIPTPLKWTITSEAWIDLKKPGWKIVAVGDFVKEAKFLNNSLTSLGYPSAEIVSTKPKSSFIELRKADPKVEADRNDSLEAYSVSVSANEMSVVISSLSTPGVFYGIQTVIGLALRNSGKVPEIAIKDRPRFEFRGMHIDVARNFHSKAAVIKHLDVMSLYKLNKLHLHLTDDEGWRLEIPGLPELTQVGGRRCDDVTEQTCVLSSLGSGPVSSNSGSGYFSVEDYKDILRYAADRHIEVIPEVDMPGHAHAAIKAMEARRNSLNDKGDHSKADEFILSDSNDQSVYESVQMFNDNAVNPCINSTYSFIQLVMTEIKKMHENINPLRTYHFGGDEVAKGAWVKSEFCKTLLESETNLKQYFTQRVSKIAAERGLNLGGWEDGLMETSTDPFSRTDLTNNDVYANAWDNVWEWGAAGKAYSLANAGYKVILSQATHLYFDHPYEPDPEERGFYWATRYTDTEKVHGFKPDDIYSNVDMTRAGDPFTREQLCGKDDEKCVKLKKQENILGMQGQLWSETVRTDNQLDYMIYPRLIALAERAWHKASWETITDSKEQHSKRLDDWTKFANTLGYQELSLLDAKHIMYRLPPPGARRKDNRLMVNSRFPGLVTEVSFNNGQSWLVVGKDGVPVENDQTVLLVTKSADNKRRSRPIQVHVIVTENAMAARISVLLLVFVIFCQFTL